MIPFSTLLLVIVIITGFLSSIGTELVITNLSPAAEAFTSTLDDEELNLKYYVRITGVLYSHGSILF